MTDWHSEDIKAGLRKAGTSLSVLARLHGVTNAVPSIALRRPSPKWERIIADALGVAAAEVWPSRYADRAKRQAARAEVSAQVAAANAQPRRLGRPPILRAAA